MKLAPLSHATGEETEAQKSHGSKKWARIGTRLVFKIYVARPLQAAPIRHAGQCMGSSPEHHQ